MCDGGETFLIFLISAENKRSRLGKDAQTDKKNYIKTSKMWIKLLSIIYFFFTVKTFAILQFRDAWIFREISQMEK